MTKLFRNAEIVDLKNGDIFKADILVENGKIAKIEKGIMFDGEVIDLENNYVLPSFVNAFMNSIEAGKENYFEDVDGEKKENLKQFFLMKNLLAGAVYVNDVCVTKVPVLEHLEEKSENELSSLSMKIAKTGEKLFVKLGQDLHSLGSIDKQYGKSAPLVLEDFGFLDRGATIVGANCLEKDDLEVLGQYDCNFIILPSEDGKVGRRQTNIISLLKRGQEVCVGSGNSAEIDFFGFMRQLIFSMRSLFESENALSESDVLKIATNGAALGFENKIKVGENATFSVICSRESLYDNVLKTLVWERSKNDVVMSVKNGEVLQKNGEIFMKNMPSYATIISGLKP